MGIIDRTQTPIYSLLQKQQARTCGWEVHVRDDGLDRAIDAAGGVAQLARKIGISQPSVSNWAKVPAQRVIAVETATGVPRNDLRPDLYSEQGVPPEPLDPVDAA